MNILIVSATEIEVKPLLDYLKIENAMPGINFSSNIETHQEVKVLISGIGMVNTAFMMGQYSNNMYDLVLNVGVCGAFDRSLELGELVHVTEDVLSEMGAEDDERFLTYDELDLPGDYIFNSHLQVSYPQIEQLKKVKGITVNTVHGNDKSIDKVRNLFNPNVESMEGAAFLASCRKVGENYTQIRAISNYVEKRDKSKWQMHLAINNLNDYLINFVDETRP
jgi:futalosine hydrolase